jgi:prepilin-type N-terminal cleavage/methylation domain-containing protein
LTEPERETVRRCGGFALLEVLVAVVVASLLLSGLLALTRQGGLAARQAHRQAEGILVARAVLASLDDRGWSQPGVFTGTQFDHHWVAEVRELLPAGAPAGRGAPGAAPLTPRALYAVRIAVTGPGPDGRPNGRSVALDAVRLQTLAP